MNTTFVPLWLLFAVLALAPHSSAQTLPFVSSTFSSPHSNEPLRQIASSSETDSAFSPGIPIGGNVEGILKSNRYMVTNSLTILAGKSLLIEPGTTLRFAKGAGFSCFGALTAQGVLGAIIAFESAQPTPAPGDWTGIVLDTPSRHQHLEYIDVAHAAIGLESIGGQGHVIRNSNFRDCQKEGLIIRGSSSSLVTTQAILRCKIFRNGSHGIHLAAAAIGCANQSLSPSIKHCAIHDNAGAGVSISAAASSSSGCIPSKSASASPRVEGNEIFNNALQGIYVRRFRPNTIGNLANYAYVSPSILNNLIRANRGHGIELDFIEAGAGTVIMNNTVHQNRGSGILHRAVDEAFRIQNNILTANNYGIEAAAVFNPSNAVISHNLLFGHANIPWRNYPSRFGQISSTNPNGIPADAHLNLNQDPLFTSSSDLRLLAASPARNAGTTNNAPAQDLTAKKRIGFPDLGCYETITPPKFINIALSANAAPAFNFTLSVEPGSSGAIEISDDLRTWRLLQHFNASGSNLVLSQPPALSPARSFRALLDE